MRKSVLLLLVLLMLLPASLALANGQEKTAVCHMDDEGTLIPISIADPAIDTHLAHGDGVVGEDYDENCEPLLAEAGCFLLADLGFAQLYVKTDGSVVQNVSGDPIYGNDTCTTLSSYPPLSPDTYLVWAATTEEAASFCDEPPVPTATPDLYACRIY